MKSIEKLSKKYPELFESYEPMMGNFVFSVKEFNSNETLRKEVLEFLKDDDTWTAKTNYAMEWTFACVEDENEDCFVIREVETWM